MSNLHRTSEKNIEGNKVFIKLEMVEIEIFSIRSILKKDSNNTSSKTMLVSNIENSPLWKYMRKNQIVSSKKA